MTRVLICDAEKSGLGFKESMTGGTAPIPSFRPLSQRSQGTAITSRPLSTEDAYCTSLAAFWAYARDISLDLSEKDRM